MIITLEHEDIEAALISWMNEKGMAANADDTSIAMSKARNTGRITAVIDPNGRGGSQAAEKAGIVLTANGVQSTTEDGAESEIDAKSTPASNLFNA